MSERLITVTIERIDFNPEQDGVGEIFAEEDTKPELIKYALGRLPKKAEEDFGWVSPLVTNGFSKEELRQKVEDRYLAIINLRKSHGFGNDAPNLTLDLTISLLDDKLFDELIIKFELEGKVLATARHEEGHAMVAVNLGWGVSSVTVKQNPAEGYLGLTVSVPPANLTFKDWLLESSAISFGGKVAAQMSGDKPHGIGADMASAQAKARIATTYFKDTFPSENAFLSEAENLAHDALRSFGPGLINRQALHLTHKETIF